MIAAIRWARGQHGLPPGCKLVLILLADMANENGVCWPGVALLARDAECDARQAQRHLRMLEERGLLRVQRRPGRTNLYILQMDGVTPAPPPEQTGDDTGTTPQPARGDTDVIPMIPRDDTGTGGGVTPAPPESSKNLKDKSDDDDKAYHHHLNGDSGGPENDPADELLRTYGQDEARRWASTRYPGDLLRQGYVWLFGQMDEAALAALTGKYGAATVTDVLDRIRQAEIRPANPVLYLNISLERELLAIKKEQEAMGRTG